MGLRTTSSGHPEDCSCVEATELGQRALDEFLYRQHFGSASSIITGMVAGVGIVDDIAVGEVHRFWIPLVWTAGYQDFAQFDR